MKNCLIYTITKPPGIDSEALEPSRFEPLAKTSFETIGLVYPAGFEELAPVLSGFTFLCAKHESKILPASVINKALQEKLEAENRHIGAKEKRSVRDELVFEMLPKAFTKAKLINVAIHNETGLMFVDTPSAGTAEMIINIMREALGSLGIIPLSTKVTPIEAMTNSLKAHEPLVGEFGDKLKLTDFSDGAVHTYKNEIIDCDELLSCIDTGMVVTEMALRTDHLSCTITDQLKLKSIKLSELAYESMGDDYDGKALEQQATALVTIQTIYSFTQALITALGGQPDNQE